MDFVGKKKIWYAISLIIIALGLFSLATQGMNSGIDFIGGNLLQVQFTKETTIQEVRNALETINLEDSKIQASENNVFIIKTKIMAESEQDNIIDALEKNIGQLEILRSENVGPTVGKEIRNASLIAFGLALALMIGYMTVRFEFKLALTAIIALFHDMLMAVVFFSFLQIEIDSTFIAALLTIFGYSVNNTIVIFDRMRENKKNNKKMDMKTLVNTSIIQTMARSINTYLTTMFVLCALFFLGGETTKNFALAMIIGITSGAYSSIFLAGPMWIDLQKIGKNKSLKKAHA